MDDYNDAEQLAGVGGSALRGAGKIANAATRRLREKAIKKAKKESAAAIRKVAHLVKMVIAGLISILGPIGIIVLSFVVIILWRLVRQPEAVQVPAEPVWWEDLNSLLLV